MVKSELVSSTSGTTLELLRTGTAGMAVDVAISRSNVLVNSNGGKIGDAVKEIATELVMTSPNAALAPLRSDDTDRTAEVMAGLEATSEMLVKDGRTKIDVIRTSSAEVRSTELVAKNGAAEEVNGKTTALAVPGISTGVLVVPGMLIVGVCDKVNDSSTTEVRFETAVRSSATFVVSTIGRELASWRVLVIATEIAMLIPLVWSTSDTKGRSELDGSTSGRRLLLVTMSDRLLTGSASVGIEGGTIEDDAIGRDKPRAREVSDITTGMLKELDT